MTTPKARTRRTPATKGVPTPSTTNETEPVEKMLDHELEQELIDVDGIVFNGLGNIVTEEPPYWRPPSTDAEVAAWQKHFKPGMRPHDELHGTLDSLGNLSKVHLTETEDLTETDMLLLDSKPAGELFPSLRMPEYPELHPEGDGKFSKCNVAELHALQNPGHSITVIQDFGTTNPLDGTILRITCHGTPHKFLADERDCYWTADLEIKDES